MAVFGFEGKYCCEVRGALLLAQMKRMDLDLRRDCMANFNSLTHFENCNVNIHCFLRN